jgi:outer membrane protein assembly factor BamB
VAAGVVYVSGGELFAFSAATGQQLWASPVGHGKSITAPTVDPAANIAVVGVADSGVLAGRFDAFNATTGAPRWSFKTDAEVQTPAVISDGVVYVGDNGGYNGIGSSIYALAEQSGAVLWRRNFGQTALGVTETVAVAAGTIYATLQVSNTLMLYALDATTGRARWSRAAVTDRSPAVSNGLLYLAGSDSTERNHLLVIDPSTGATVRDVILATHPEGTPAVLNGNIYVPSSTGLYDYTRA